MYLVTLSQQKQYDIFKFLIIKKKLNYFIKNLIEIRNSALS